MGRWPMAQSQSVKIVRSQFMRQSECRKAGAIETTVCGDGESQAAFVLYRAIREAGKLIPASSLPRAPRPRLKAAAQLPAPAPQRKPQDPSTPENSRLCGFDSCDHNRSILAALSPPEASFPLRGAERRGLDRRGHRRARGRAARRRRDRG